MRHLRIAAIAAGGLLLAGLGVALTAWPAGATTTLPRVVLSAKTLDTVEGNGGTTAVTFDATLSKAATTPVTVGYQTVDGSAKVADHDYQAKSGTITFPVGSVRQPITVSVIGDTVLEDYQQLTVQLTTVSGATLGPKVEHLQIDNDDNPKVSVPAPKAAEGSPVTFKVRLLQRYYQPITATVKTIDGTAKAPGDYTPVTTTVTFPAGSTAAIPVPVATVADTVGESSETFSLQVSGTHLAATVTGKGTITQPVQCPSGTPATAPPPGGPPSPSSPVTLGPPAAVTGGTPWDLMFQDTFDSAAATSAKWSNGMRDGEQTLEGNAELTWYEPQSSVDTVDNDGTGPISVLRQTLSAQTVPGEYYTARTLNRIYPAAMCPQYYTAGKTTGTAPTKVPYQFTSGMLNNAKSFGFKYGYVEARVKMPKGFALWPALWLRDWQAWHYEVDVMEGFDRDARTYRTTYWWGNGQHHSVEDETGGDLGLLAAGGTCHAAVPIPATTDVPGECSLATTVDLSAGFHTVGLNWTPTGYQFYLDGREVWESAPGANIAHTYNHLILSLGLGNNDWEFDWTREQMRPLDPNVLASTAFSKPTMEWDYVRVWQSPTGHDTCTTGSC